MTNEQIIKNVGMTTVDATGAGLLKPEQSRMFIKQAFNATPLMPLVRHEMRRARTGQLDKIGIAARVIRQKVEDIDANADGSVPVVDPNTGQITGYRAKAIFSTVKYSTEEVRLPWEVSNNLLRENIEGQSLESTITDLM